MPARQPLVVYINIKVYSGVTRHTASYIAETRSPPCYFYRQKLVTESCDRDDGDTVTGVCGDVTGTTVEGGGVDGNPAAEYQDVTYGVVQKRRASNVNPTTTDVRVTRRRYIYLIHRALLPDPT